ncbi:hypothetical protein PR048_002095 [Dryococelus australis]|uniref:Uncharacterized protein n=1 Tax=Dryococelus australis TaxID=614101 RepID=A0ABQ9IJ70_9NEOP|nr:hypothetical protein PR048_002095 [Dryococelus australis]
MRKNKLPKSFPMTYNSILLKKEMSHHESAIYPVHLIFLELNHSLLQNYISRRRKASFNCIILASIVRKWVMLTVWTKLARSLGKKYTQLEFRREIVQVYLSRFANASKGLGRPSTSSS